MHTNPSTKSSGYHPQQPQSCSLCPIKTADYYLVRIGQAKRVVCRECYERMMSQSQWSNDGSDLPQSCNAHPGRKESLSSTRVIRRGKAIE